MTALDPTTSQIKFTVPVPDLGQFTEQNVSDISAFPGAQASEFTGLFCTPGTSQTNSLGSLHGFLSVSSDGTVYLPLFAHSLVLDGLPCDPSTDPATGLPHGVNTGSSSWNTTFNSYLMVIHSDGSSSIQGLDSTSASGTNWFLPFDPEPTLGRAIPDGQGGVLLQQQTIPVAAEPTNINTIAVSWPRTLFHFTSSGTSKIGLPIEPKTPDHRTNDDPLLVGENGTAYLVGFSSNTSSVDTIAAIDTVGNSVKWTASPGLYPTLSTVTSDGSVTFQYQQGDSSQHSAITDQSCRDFRSPPPHTRRFKGTFKNPFRR